MKKNTFCAWNCTLSVWSILFCPSFVSSCLFQIPRFCSIIIPENKAVEAETPMKGGKCNEDNATRWFYWNALRGSWQKGYQIKCWQGFIHGCIITELHHFDVT